MNSGSFEDAPLALSAGDDLAAAYRSLPARGAVVVACTPAEAPALLRAAEAAGFFGMRLEPPGLRAWKGKAGPCFETGRSASYRGSALAAMDDDGHLLLGTLRVCEKTAAVYRSPAYAGLIDVGASDPALSARLDRDPVPFDCDTFQRDAEALAARVAAPSPGPRRAILYPGPFRRLILTDGSLVRRGEPVSVAAAQAGPLVDRDGARLLDSDAPPAEDFARLFREQGPACLLEAAGTVDARAGARLETLGDAPLKLRKRLAAVIRRGDDYFLLSGSDPGDPSGCCPSDDVGAAMVLVRAGVLDRTVPSPDAACPSTLFTFAGELRVENGRPAVTKNEAFRKRVLDYLESGKGLAPRILVRILLFALLALGAAGLLRRLWGG